MSSSSREWGVGEDLRVTAMAVQMSSSSREGSREVSMDARLWGRLQDHIDLAVAVYAMLPIEDFFRLRVVCKEWNRLASDRAFLERAIPRAIPSPSFVMGGRQWSINWPTMTVGSWLLYKEPGAQWTWTRLPLWEFEVGGLLYDPVESTVFNVHTRVFHALPPLPKPLQRGPFQAPIHMTVSGSAARQYSFQVFSTYEDFDVWIYASDSGCWSQRVSTHVNCLDHCALKGSCSTTYPYNRSMYLRKLLNDATPNFHMYYNEGSQSAGRNLETGAEWMVIHTRRQWHDHVFIFGLKIEHECFTISAFEYCFKDPRLKLYWVLFDQMPNDVCAWMLVDEIKDGIRDNRKIQMQTLITDNYVLLYVGLGLGDMAERAVLYNLEQKTWEKVQMSSPRLHPLLQPKKFKLVRHAYNP